MVRRIAFGVFAEDRLVGASLFGPGPKSVDRLTTAARPEDAICLTRFWLADELGNNAESRALGYCLRCLRGQTGYKAVVTYADPSAGGTGQ